MRICLILEGCYPYVHGGVSTWMHQYIEEMKEHEFILWVIGDEGRKRGKFVYELPENVVEVHEVFLDEALKVRSSEQRAFVFKPEEIHALTELLKGGAPDWKVLVDLYQNRGLDPVRFLMSREFLDGLTEICKRDYPYLAFADAFHTMRSMLLPLFYLLSQKIPKADFYHAISTGYGGILGTAAHLLYKKPFILTEHGIYTREREEEIIRAKWVVPSFKKQWIQFFYMLSAAAYDAADYITSLFYGARTIQISLGADPEKCRVIANGVDYERFSQIPKKKENGWIDIGAVVRLAPIKDIKTMIYAFYELAQRLPDVRLHIMGGVDDEEYAQECYELVQMLKLDRLIFTGRVDVVSYMETLDFTILTSISEGQPLSVLESLAAGRPCVTTDVGCCRELLNGNEEDRLGSSGFYVAPMHRQMLADAMERMAVNQKERERMGEIGKKRVEQYYKKEKMMRAYRALYKEAEQWQESDLS